MERILIVKENTEHVTIDIKNIKLQKILQSLIEKAAHTEVEVVLVEEERLYNNVPIYRSPI